MVKIKLKNDTTLHGMGLP